MRHKACANAIKASAASLEQKVTTSPTNPNAAIHTGTQTLLFHRETSTILCLERRLDSPSLDKVLVVGM
jgi:hypothetical protein